MEGRGGLAVEVREETCRTGLADRLTAGRAVTREATGQSAFESHPGRCMWANALGTWCSHGLINPMRTGRPGLGVGAASGPVRGQSGRVFVSRKELAPASQEPWAQASSWCCRQGDPELSGAPVQAQAWGDRAQSPPMDQEEEEGWGGAAGQRCC